MTSHNMKRYSSFVGLMKIILPVGILLTIGLAIGWPYLHSVEKDETKVVDISSPDIKENRMVQPQYVSTDKKGQPFTVDAEWAKRKNENLSDLVKPHGTMIMTKGETLELNAKTGQYDNEKKILNLEGDVTLTSSDGYRLKTEHAHVDTEEKIIEGDSYIEGEGPAGSIMGQNGFKVENKAEGKKLLTLKGQSRVIINRSAVKQKKEQNAP
jgi:lipopolysaccharide export system protein LptC